MHIAKHVFRFDVDGGRQHLLYNPLTAAMDVVDAASYRRLTAAGADDGALDGSAPALEYMLERGYVYRDTADEKAAVAAALAEYLDRERRSNLRFVLLPTLQCNARCAYCFIGKAIGQEDLMNDATLDLAFSAMDRVVAERGAGCTRQLSLFGGEPLIDTPAQRRLIERILEQAADRDFLVDAVTNGLDLTHYTELLARHRVHQVQVTFDGLPEYAARRRRAVDGRGGSFDRIVAGVNSALARGVKVNARILLDRNSIETLPELVRQFKTWGWFDDAGFAVHIGSVFDCFRCHPAKERAKHLGVVEGNERLYQICRREPEVADLLALDWQGVGRLLSTGKFFPPTFKTCFGGSRTFAFSPEGGIYVCETTAGRPEYRIGTFAPELHFDEERTRLLENRNVTTIPECQDCAQALLCAGGCAFNAYVEHGTLAGPGCRMIKETLQYGIDFYWPQLAALMAGEPTAARRAAGADCCPTPDRVR